MLCDSSTESPAWCSSSQPRNFILPASSNFILLHPGTQHHRVTPPIVRLTLTPLALTSPQGQVSLAGYNREDKKNKNLKRLTYHSSHEQEGSRVLCQVFGTRFQPSKKRNRAQRVCTRVRLNMKAADGVLSNHG